MAQIFAKLNLKNGKKAELLIFLTISASGLPPSPQQKSMVKKDRIPIVLFQHFIA